MACLFSKRLEKWRFVWPAARGRKNSVRVPSRSGQGEGTVSEVGDGHLERGISQRERGISQRPARPPRYAPGLASAVGTLCR